MEPIQLSGDLLRRIQKTQLQILIDVANFCDENNICYFLTSGTLLGAVRHKGFIPWDDDIDISMPRKDFERFILLSNKLPKDYVFQATCVDSNYPNIMAKVRKIGTTMKEPVMAHLDIEHGIWIDIFPLDEVLDVKKLEKRRKKIEIISTAICYKLKTRKILKIRTEIICVLLGMIGVENLDKLRTKIMKKENDKNGQFITSFGSNLGCTRLMFKKEVYFPVRLTRFEGQLFKVPNKTEEWLNGAYGDYNVLPAINDRVNRHKVNEVIV